MFYLDLIKEIRDPNVRKMLDAKENIFLFKKTKTVL